MNVHVQPKNAPAAGDSLNDLLAHYDDVALVFQGGGAIGAYQAGVYQALFEAGIEPTWLTGVSIGAINAAIVAGNPPARRLERLQEFWETISGRKIWYYTPDGDLFRTLRNQASAFLTMTMGQPGFFAPRQANPWLQFTGATGATSFYDSAPLKETLERLVDWDLVNDGGIRLSVGAVNIRSGNSVYFDNRTECLTPEHVMASGALPPALPPIKIENELYWDGGIVSNTPLQYLLDHLQLRDTLIFQIDLFSARGDLPRDMPGVLARHKDIMYSSRTRNNTDTFSRLHLLRLRLKEALIRLPEDQRTEEDRQLLEGMADIPQINIVHVIYQQKSYEGHAKDYEFSGTSMREHWSSGYEDTKKTLRHRQWLEIPDEHTGLSIHDVHRDGEN